MKPAARGRHRLYGQKITLSQTVERVVAASTCCAVHPTLCVGQAPANMQQFPLPPSDAFPEVLLRCKAHVHNWVDNSKQRKLFSALKNSGALRMRFKADILFMASLSMVFVHLWPRLKCLSGAWFPTQAARETFLPCGGMARTPHNLDFLSGALANDAAAGLASYSCVFCGLR